MIAIILVDTLPYSNSLQRHKLEQLFFLLTKKKIQCTFLENFACNHIKQDLKLIFLKLDLLAIFKQDSWYADIDICAHVWYWCTFFYKLCIFLAQSLEEMDAFSYCLNFFIQKKVYNVSSVNPFYQNIKRNDNNFMGINVVILA